MNHLKSCKTRPVRISLGMKNVSVKGRAGKTKQVLKEFFFDGLYCKDHKIKICRCGYEFGKHPFTIERLAKDWCMSCNAPLNKDNYKISGNFCPKCCGEAADRAKSKTNILLKISVI